MKKKNTPRLIFMLYQHPPNLEHLLECIQTQEALQEDVQHRYALRRALLNSPFAAHSTFFSLVWVRVIQTSIPFLMGGMVVAVVMVTTLSFGGEGTVPEEISIQFLEKSSLVSLAEETDSMRPLEDMNGLFLDHTGKFEAPVIVPAGFFTSH